jgi:hypothetical protein
MPLSPRGSGWISLGPVSRRTPRLSVSCRSSSSGARRTCASVSKAALSLKSSSSRPGCPISPNSLKGMMSVTSLRSRSARRSVDRRKAPTAGRSRTARRSVDRRKAPTAGRSRSARRSVDRRKAPTAGRSRSAQRSVDLRTAPTAGDRAERCWVNRNVLGA